MALNLGTRLGPYEVTAQIGVGGMGEVYRATDTNLGRQVAIKVLPDAFPHDVDRLARFEREAKTLATLNHPHIAAIYGFEKSGGAHALVMELVEGPTLADRIAQGAMPIDEALPIAKQIAEALEAAHEQGIIHRDLKPANIKVRPDGTVKVLDFGLAKASQPAGAALGATSLSMSPTITSPAMTEAGIILGTAAYMSPEQARGVAVDRRADLWAFGALLYEMLTGGQLFEGATVSDTLAHVLMKEPDRSALPPGTPAPMRKLLRRCLEKDRRQRLDSAAAARLDVEEGMTGSAAETPAPAASLPSSGHGARVAWIVAATAVLISAGFTIAVMRDWLRTPAGAPPETRTEISTPFTSDSGSFALSPDGRSIVFAATGDGTPRLWLRSLGATTAQPLAGTESAIFPFWSPDSKSLGFFSQGSLKRLDLGGGAPQTVATAPLGRGGTWGANGVILFSPDFDMPLSRVAASGGTVTLATRLERDGHIGQEAPLFLPDGRHFLFYALGSKPDTSGIYLGALDSAETTRLTAADRPAAYLPSGWLVLVRGGTIVAQRLDLDRQRLEGDPVTVAEGVAASASTTGLVAYRSGGANRRQLTWFDRTGKALGTLGAADDNNLRLPSVSPDGQRAAVTRTVQGNTDVWLVDGTRTSRFTFDPGIDRYPIWSPDGSRIVFDSDRSGPRNLYVKPATGAGSETLLVESAAPIKVPTDWSRDGQFLLYFSIDPQSTPDLWVQPMSGAPEAGLGHSWTFLKSKFNDVFARFSPDGRWLPTSRTNQAELRSTSGHSCPCQRLAGPRHPLEVSGRYRRGAVCFRHGAPMAESSGCREATSAALMSAGFRSRWMIQAGRDAADGRGCGRCLRSRRAWARRSVSRRRVGVV